MPVGTIETRTLAPVATLGYAVDCLVSAVSELSSISPPSSGIIRLENGYEGTNQAGDQRN